MPEQKTTEKRSLRYDFSASEMHDIGVSLAVKTKEHDAILDEKKSANSNFKARIDKIDAEINLLCNHMTDGYEMREVEVDVVFNKPEQGRKTIIRKDTDKIVAVEKMTDDEWNLFNQPMSDDEIAESIPSIATPRRRRRRNESE